MLDNSCPVIEPAANTAQPIKTSNAIPVIQCWFDGACEPDNPGGNMGIGAVIHADDGSVIATFSHFVPAGPDNSNNVAEYQGFEWLLDTLLKLQLQDRCVIIRGDSKMVIAQMYGVSGKKWKIKEGRYVPYARRCVEKLQAFTNLTCHWIPREENYRADQLSKEQFVKHNVTLKIQPAQQ